MTALPRNSDLGALLARLERQVASLAKSTRLTYSSIDDGAMQVVVGGSLRGVLGQQYDGTVALNPVNGPPPPTPTAPLLATALGGIKVTWDGGFADSVVGPLDFARVEIHVSTVTGFTPTPATMVGSLESPQGGTFGFTTAYVPQFVRLLARSTSGVASLPSAQATITPSQVANVDLSPLLTIDTQIADAAITAAKIASNAVTVSKIADAAIEAGKLAAGAVTATALASAAVTSVKLAANAVQSANIANDAVTAAAIAAGAVTASELGDAAVTAAALASGSVGSVALASAAVTSAALAANAVTAPAIAASAVTAGKIDAGAVTAGTIAANAVTTTALAANAVTAAKITAGTITSTELAANSVTASQIAANSVTAGKINAAAVTAGNIAAGAVQAGNIAALAIVAGDISSNAITTAKIAANAVTAGQIAAATITASEIAAGAIIAGKIAANAVDVNALAANSVTAAKIVSGTITASQIAAATITGDRLVAATITGDRIVANTITAGNIQAGSITALLVSGDTIRAGSLANGTARVELTSSGLKLISRSGGGVDSTVVDLNSSTGNGTFTGTITGSFITGSQVVLNNADSTGYMSLNSGGALFYGGGAYGSSSASVAGYLGSGQSGGASTPAIGVILQGPGWMPSYGSTADTDAQIWLTRNALPGNLSMIRLSATEVYHDAQTVVGGNASYIGTFVAPLTVIERPGNTRLTEWRATTGGTVRAYVATDGSVTSTGTVAGTNLPATLNLTPMTAPQSYSPVVTGATTNPNVGTGATRSGSYFQVGKLVFVNIIIALGTSPSAGSGAYSVSLPVAAAAATSISGLFQTSTVAQRVPIAGIISGASISRIEVPVPNGMLGTYGGNWGSTIYSIGTGGTPAMVATDQIIFTGCYLAA